MQTYDSPFDVEGRLAPVVIVADLGNNFLKVSRLRYEEVKHKEAGVFTEERVIEHAFVNLTPRGWMAEVENADGQLTRGKQAQTHAFQIKVGRDWKPVKIGDGVSSHKGNKPLLASQKYQAGGIDALLCASLCELLPVDEYPDGHNNIILGIGYPPTEFAQVRNVVKLMQPKNGHQIKLPDGSKRTFIVRVVIPFDESIGGLMHMQYNLISNGRMRGVDGQWKSNPLRAGDSLLLLDAGGRLGSMGRISYNGGNNFEVDYDSFKPIEGGMITVRNAVRESLSAIYHKELRGVSDSGMSDAWVDRILRTRKMVIRGDHANAIDVNAEVEQSLEYLAKLRDVYRNEFDGGAIADHIMLTGGTISTLYNEISEELNHYSMIPVSELSSINQANERGARHIIIDTLKANNALPRQFQGWV